MQKTKKNRAISGINFFKKKAVKIKKRCVTLIEMMIVMFLIAMIIGVVGYNYQGSLDKGKTFKSKAGIAKLESVLMLHLAENPGADIQQWTTWVEQSPIVKNHKELLLDGWGKQYNVEMKNGGVLITDSKGNSNS